MGKGLIGLVAKPASGLVGFFGHTVQGAANTPGTIKKSVKKTKNKNKPDEDDMEANEE